MRTFFHELLPLPEVRTICAKRASCGGASPAVQEFQPLFLDRERKRVMPAIPASPIQRSSADADPFPL